MKKVIIGSAFVIIILMLVFVVYSWGSQEIQFHNLDAPLPEDFSNINSIRQISVSIIASLLLSLITIMYVLYTKGMVEETKKMASGTLEIAALNKRLWRHSAMPLFYPSTAPELDFVPGTHYIIEIKNIGGIALLCEISFSLNKYENKYTRIDPDIDFKIAFELPLQPKRINDFKKSFTIDISFYDKAAIKYTQVLNYEFKENKWVFVFDKTNLPKELILS